MLYMLMPHSLYNNLKKKQIRVVFWIECSILFTFKTEDTVYLSYSKMKMDSQGSNRRMRFKFLQKMSTANHAIVNVL